MKKRFPPSSTWAKLSKAYRHRRKAGSAATADATSPEAAGNSNVHSGTESYTGSMDNRKTIIDGQEVEAEDPRTVDPPSAVDDAAAGSRDGSDLQALTAERDRLLIERADLQDRLLRRQAEFDNFRRRAERERADILEYANTQTVRALLPILDDFERALKVESADREYARGMELIYQRLADALKKLGLESITSTGQAFDPNVHHAVDRVETDEVEDNTVVEEYQRGYNFRGKLLRPAMVKVAVRKS